jgi:hypothetical protein
MFFFSFFFLAGLSLAFSLSLFSLSLLSSLSLSLSLFSLSLEKTLCPNKTKRNRMVPRLPRHLPESIWPRQGQARRPRPRQARLRREQAAGQSAGRARAAVVCALPRRRREAGPLHRRSRAGSASKGKSGAVRGPEVRAERGDRGRSWVRAVAGAEGVAGEAAAGRCGGARCGGGERLEEGRRKKNNEKSSPVFFSCATCFLFSSLERGALERARAVRSGALGGREERERGLSGPFFV